VSLVNLDRENLDVPKNLYRKTVLFYT